MLTASERALEQLVSRESPSLKAFLRGMTASEADAEDAFQETWLRFLRANGAVRAHSVRAYLFRTARAVLTDRYRRACTAAVEMSFDADGGLLVEMLADCAPTPVEAFVSRATVAEVKAAVQSLPAGPREVFLLRTEGELSFREIADEMKIPLGTALTWMRAASLKLRKTLEAKHE